MSPEAKPDRFSHASRFLTLFLHVVIFSCWTRLLRTEPLLPNLQRRSVFLCFLEGHSLEQVSDGLLTEGTAQCLRPRQHSGISSTFPRWALASLRARQTAMTTPRLTSKALQFAVVPESQ